MLNNDNPKGVSVFLICLVKAALCLKHLRHSWHCSRSVDCLTSNKVIFWSLLMYNGFTIRIFGRNLEVSSGYVLDSSSGTGIILIVCFECLDSLYTGFKWSFRCFFKLDLWVKLLKQRSHWKRSIILSSSWCKASSIMVLWNSSKSKSSMIDWLAVNVVVYSWIYNKEKMAVIRIWR